MEGLGDRIQAFRSTARLSQAELARRAKVSKAYLSELEKSAGRKPSAELLLRIADVLEVTIADLLGKTVRPQDPTEIPPGLRAFAVERGLSQDEIRVLATIRLREGTPKSKARWAHIYDSIRGSRHLDEET